MRRTTLLQRVIKILGIFAITVLFFACSDEFNSENKIEEQQEKAVVSFKVTDGSERTVLPQVSLADVARFELLGGIDGEAETVLIESFTGTGTTVSLYPGVYNFTLNAYNSSDELILQGKVLNRQISLTGTNQVNFSMSVLNGGTGNIQVTLNFPTTAGITKIIVKGDVTSQEFSSIAAGSFVYTKNGISIGDYFINFELYNGNTLLTVVSELAVVQTNLTSSKTITLVGDDLKPVLTGSVSITGAVLVGDTLAANISALNGTSAVSYQWKRGNTNVGSNEGTYIIQAGDVGGTITVTVTRDNYIGEVTSSPTAAVPAAVNVTLSSVTQDGTSTQTTTLLTLNFSAAITGLAASNITITHSVAGQVIVKGVPTASGNNYTLPISGFTSGGTLSVAVAKPGYNISGSPKTDIPVYCYSPPLTGTVGIDGRLVANQVLSAVTSNLGGSGAITYEWRRGSTVVGTNSSTYTVVALDVNNPPFTLRVTRAGYSGYIDSLPLISGSVTITGTTQVGQTLTASTTSLGGSGTISYQWKRGSDVIGTNSTYILQSADAGNTITVTVTRADNTGSVSSAATATITLPNLTGSVSITGTAQKGQTLSVVTSSLGGSGTISYQWNRSGTAISGATGSTYIPQLADIGYTITVTVTRAGYSGSVTSAATAVVIGSSNETQIFLPFSTDVESTITTTNTTNIYVLTLAQQGTLTLKITSPGGAAGLLSNAADVKWYNSSGTLISGTSSGFILPYNETKNDMAIGTYYIEIVGRSGAGNTGKYTIRVDYSKNEIEPNNTTGTAQLVVPGLTINGSITSTDSIDMFKYVLTEPGRLTIYATRETNNEFYLRWYTSDGTQISSTDVWNSNYSGSFDFEAGTYYIGIVQYGSNTGTYTLRGDFAAAGNNETEQNNTLQTAQTLTVGQTVKGFISFQDDKDYYKYVLTAPGRFTVIATRETNSEFYLRWYTSDGTRISSTDVWNSNYSGSFDLEAGTYYIGIEKYGSNTGTYTLTSEFVAAGNNETEPNNTRQNAQLLSTSGQTIKGFISYQDDIDMYRVVLSSQRTLTVAATRETNTEFYVKWYNADGVQLKSTDVWNSNYSVSDTLAAGTYYISIEKYGGNTGTYTLTVTW